MQSINWESSVLWAVLSAFFISAAGNVINDFYDLEIDVINRPDRILPSKKISPSVAYIYSVLLFIMGLLFSVLTQNTYCIILAFINTFLLFYYAKYFKQVMLLGNLVIAWAAASTFLFGGLASDNLMQGLIPAGYAFLYTLIREFIKDGEDVEGDRKWGAKTLPVVAGTDSVIYASVVPYAAMIAFSLYLNQNYLMPFHTYILMILAVHIPLLVYLLRLRFKPVKETFSAASKFFKINMLILLIVLLTAILNMEKFYEYLR